MYQGHEVKGQGHKYQNLFLEKQKKLIIWKTIEY